MKLSSILEKKTSNNVSPVLEEKTPMRSSSIQSFTLEVESTVTLYKLHFYSIVEDVKEFFTYSRREVTYKVLFYTRKEDINEVFICVS